MRVEHDSLGKKAVDSEAYYGINTQRAYENFQISGIKTSKETINAIAMIKVAAARANNKLRLLDNRKAKAIERAAKEVIAGKFDGQFILDIFQAGAGTATHMNVNEVIANRANEILGGRKGSYKFVHPNDHVNMAQSTNDVFPSAIRISCMYLIDELLIVLKNLENSFRNKANEFRNIIKSGRTHLQDAVPISLGQEVNGWADTVRELRKDLDKTKEKLKKISLGGTAVGTGVNAHPRYKELVIKELKKITKLQLQSASNLIEATQSMGDFVFVSGVLRGVAVELSRIASDVRLLSSGPRTGFNELILPAVEAGSSIMPGKINPSIAEMVNMVCFQVIGNGVAVETAALSGQLELNVFMPVIGNNLIFILNILNNAIKAFDEKCVRRMRANKEACNYYFEYGLGLAALLNPVIGYEKAAEVAKAALKERKTVKQIVLERKILDEVELNRLIRETVRSLK